MAKPLEETGFVGFVLNDEPQIQLVVSIGSSHQNYTLVVDANFEDEVLGILGDIKVRSVDRIGYDHEFIGTRDLNLTNRDTLRLAEAMLTLVTLRNRNGKV